MWNSYLRWRHSKGYGVHSPYAYRFVNDVVRPGNYGYYAYGEAERLAMKWGVHTASPFKLIKFLIRLAVFLKSSRILIYGRKCEEAKIAANALNLPVRIIKGGLGKDVKPQDLVIIEGEEPDEKEIRDVLSKQAPVMAINPSKKIREILLKPLDKGVLFIGKTKILLIPRREMSYVSYLLRFPC